LQELADNLSLDTAIMDRMNEMASTLWHLTGDDFRDEKVDEKTKIVQRLHI